MKLAARVLVSLLVACAGSFAAAQSGSAVPDGLSPSDWAAIRSAHEAGRHRVFASEGGHLARNAGQRWEAHFDGRGLTVTPDAGGWSWGLELDGYGWSDLRDVASAPLLVRAEGHRLEYDWDARLTEWYVNDARGLEHGYTVNQRAEGDSPLRLALSVRGGLRPRVAAGGRDVRFVDRADQVALTYSGLTVFDAAGKALDASWRVEADGLRLEVDDRDAVYPLTVDPIAQQAYLKASNTGAGDGFGFAVAVSGDTVVVGATGEDSAATGVDGDQNDSSASSAGAAYVFVRDGATWSQQAYLKASNTDAQDKFGASVAVSDETIVVGAIGEDSSAVGVDGDPDDDGTPNSGAAYVFVRSGTSWSQQAYMKASNTDSGDGFGFSLALSGDTLVVGATGEASGATGVDGDQSDDSVVNAGAAYVFVRVGTTWSQQAYLKASNTGAYDEFSRFAVAVDGDTVVVGAMTEDSISTGVDGDPHNDDSSNAGAAYVFFRSGTTWSPQAYLKASDTETGDLFGASVAVSGDTIAVGAPGEDSSATGVDGEQVDYGATNSGAVYVFERSGAAWSQTAYVKASNTDAYDSFGGETALAGDALVVAAASERSGATGVDGDQTDDSAGAAGAAYLFVRSAGTWSQDAYLKASNTEAFDRFGSAIALDGETLIVGAPDEDGGATGVDGDQASNTLVGAGAAYVFDLSAPWGSYCPATANSTGAPADIDALGSPSITANDFTLTAAPVPNQPYLFFHGPARAQLPFGNGFRCVGAPLVRLFPAAVAVGNLATRPVDLAALGFQPGTRYFQCWYRDPSGGAGFNLSKGLEVLFQP